MRLKIQKIRCIEVRNYGRKMERIEQRIKDLEEQMEDVKRKMPQDHLSMVVFSGDLDRLLAAFIIAVGASAMFERVVMFFTFWGIPAMRDIKKHLKKADVIASMFDKMLPKGSTKLKLSQMHMAGLGTNMMKGLMKKKGVMSLEDLMKAAADYGVEIVICEMSMDLMGFSLEELINYPNISLGGVAKFLQEAGESKVTLFI
jgi:peroxiredoxin family protein